MSKFMFDFVSEDDLAPKKADLKAGEVSFRISGIFDTKKDGSPLTTMDGTPKLTLSLWVIDSVGAQGNVYDDFTSRTAWKFKALFDSIGLSHLYTPLASNPEFGGFDPMEIKDCTGRCIIELKKSEGYEDRMIVKRYLKPKAHTDSADYSAQLPDDALPF